MSARHGDTRQDAQHQIYRVETLLITAAAGRPPINGAKRRACEGPGNGIRPLVAPWECEDEPGDYSERPARSWGEGEAGFWERAMDLSSPVVETIQVDTAARLDAAFRSGINAPGSGTSDGEGLGRHSRNSEFFSARYEWMGARVV